MDHDAIYQQIHALQKLLKKQPCKLETQDGVFILDPDNSHHVEWFNDEKLNNSQRASYLDSSR